jgi:hypothetical protein
MFFEVHINGPSFCRAMDAHIVYPCEPLPQLLFKILPVPELTAIQKAFFQVIKGPLYFQVFM